MFSSRTLAGLPLSLWAIGLLGVGTGAVFALGARSAATPSLATAPTRAALVASASTGARSDAPRGATVAGEPAGTPLRLRDSRPHAPRAEAPPSDGRNLGRTLFLLALVLAAGVALIYTRQKAKGGGTAAGRKRKELQVRSTIRIGGRWQIALVDVPGATLVVGASDKGLTLLTRLDPEGDADDIAGFDALDDAVAAAEARTARDRSPSEQHRQDFLERLIGQLREDEGADAPAPPRRGPAPPATRPARPIALSAEARALKQKLARFGQQAQEKAAS